MSQAWWLNYNLASCLEKLARRGAPENHAAVPMHAPVLIVPRIFEPELCRRLIASNCLPDVAGQAVEEQLPLFPSHGEALGRCGGTDQGGFGDVRAVEGTERLRSRFGVPS